MKTEPVYISQAKRIAAAWRVTGRKLGLDGATAREVYMSVWFAGIQSSDFHSLVERGQLTREKVLRGVDLPAVLRTLNERKKNTAIAIDPVDLDSLDRVNFHSKSFIEVGDEVEATETKKFLHSKKQYLTKGKRYRVLSLTDKGFGDYSLTTTTNIPKMVEYSCSHSVTRIFRAGKLIWDSSAAWILDHDKTHPEQPYIRTRKDKALFAKLGW